MTYINYSVLEAIDGASFRETKPFPWVNPQGALAEDAYKTLTSNFPDLSLFTKTAGMERGYGQKPHDRYELKYKPGLSVGKKWQSFVDEIFGERYQKEMARILGTSQFTTRCQWQAAYAGCSVSPHCDSANKLGSQIFYMNTPEDWQDDWGGRTLVLDDKNEKDCASAPDLSEFTIAAASQITPNMSFIFMRSNHSWHAVENLECPEGEYRKLFTVVFDRTPSLAQRVITKAKQFINVSK